MEEEEQCSPSRTSRAPPCWASTPSSSPPPPVRSGGSFRVLLDRLLVKSLLGILSTHKAAAAFLQEGEGGAWTDSVETLLACGQALKTGQVGLD